MKSTSLSITTAALLAGVFATAQVQALPLVGLTDSNQLLRFDSSTPNVVNAVTVSNLAAGESIISIDQRNPDNQLYGLSSLGNLYALNAATGTASAVGSGLVPAFAAGASYEIDWNPNNNNLRVIGNAATPNSNRAYTFATGITAVQTALSRADGGGSVDVVGAAYNNNVPSTPATTLSLYYIDAASDALFINTNAFGGGVLTKVGDLTFGGVSFGVNNTVGFDIAADGSAFLASRENLYQINLATGALTPKGSIGGNFNVIGLTSIAAVPEPGTYGLMLSGLALLGWSVRRNKRG